MSPSPMRRVLTRRTLLTDLGRATLATVVLGTSLVACSPDDDTAEEAGRVDDGASTGSLAWERASFGFVSAYVLVRDGEAAVFDTGGSDDGVEPIAQALAAAGVGWDALGHVIISHRHGDHAGGIENVAEAAPDAVLYAGTADFDGLRDRVTTARAVRDGDRILGLRIIDTPGHTPGHISAYDEDSGLLLAGDAMVHDRSIGGTTGDGIEASPPDFTANTADALASVQTLAALSPTAILFGHGDPLADDAARQLQEYANGL